MILKFCGLKNQSEVNLCYQYNIDFIGFVFYKNSPRNININDFASLKFQHTSKVTSKVVSVFKNPTIQEINTVLNSNTVDLIQIHGENVDEVLEYFKSQIKIIKAFNTEIIDNNLLLKYNFCSYFLFDGKSEGSGNKRDFSFAKNLSNLTTKPFFLAGGIDINNFQEPLKYTNYIDLSSGLEIERGVKSLKKMEEFAQTIK